MTGRFRSPAKEAGDGAGIRRGAGIIDSFRHHEHHCRSGRDNQRNGCGTGDALESGQLELAKFVNPVGLNPIGGNLYTETPSSGKPILGAAGSEGFGTLMPQSLESSNVDVVEEMVSMIVAQRAYEINSKTIQTVEDMLTMANNLQR